MDLMYLPDAFTFNVIRSPAYDSREYLDAAWEEEEEERRRRRQKGKQGGRSPPNAANEAAHRGGHPRRAQGGGKDACPLCKERKRRTLATYIRSKSRQDSECTIEEEEEEEKDAGCGGGEDAGLRPADDFAPKDQRALSPSRGAEVKGRSLDQRESE